MPGLFLLLNEIEELDVMMASGQHRTVAIGVRLRPHEKDEIEEAARRRGKWPSELAREAALRSARRVLRDTDSETTRN